MTVMASTWGQDAVSFILTHGKTVSDFSANDLWKAGLPEPPNPMAIGIVLKAMAKDKMIEKVGLEGTRRGNGGIIMRWKVL